MKKAFLIFFILILIVVGGVAFFIATFDANKYKSLIEEKATEALGNPVKIGDLDLKWDGGIAFSMQDLGVYKESKSTPALELVEATATLKLMPLLNRSVEIGTIQLLRPDLEITKDARGEISVSGVSLPKSSTKDSSGKEAAALPFLISTVQIEKGHIIINDQSQSPPIRIELHDLDIEIKNVSLVRPMDIKVAVGIFSKQQNIFFSGRFYPNPTSTSALKDAELEVDLSSIDLPTMMKSLPDLRRSGLKSPLRGKLKLYIEEVELGDNPLDSLIAKVSFKDGHLQLAGITSPLSDIQLKSHFANDRLEIQKFRTDFAKGAIDAHGEITQLSSSQPTASLGLSVDRLNLGEILPPIRRGEPSIRGIFTFTFSGNATGFDPESIKRTITGSGKMKMDEGVLLNLNILREVFDKFSMIPGFMERLQARLPENYLEKLDQENTVLNPIHIPFDIQKGLVRTNELQLSTEEFEITGTSAIGLSDASIQAQAMLRTDPALSESLTRSVEELRYISDADGRLAIPLQIQGQAPRILILPDLQYLGSKLIASKAQDLLGDFLNKQLGREEAPADNTEAPSTPAEDPVESQEDTGNSQVVEETDPQTPQNPEDALGNLLGGLLNKALEDL